MINKAILLGRLGADPELMYTKNGGAMLRFSVATNESYTDKSTGQKEERTQWHSIVIYGPFAETMSRCLVKGTQVYLEGKIETNKVTKKDGTDAFYTNIVAKTVRRVGSPSQPVQATRPAQATQPVQDVKDALSGESVPVATPVSFEDEEEAPINFFSNSTK